MSPGQSWPAGHPAPAAPPQHQHPTAPGFPAPPASLSPQKSGDRPKPKPDPGPGPRRSRTGLVTQYVLQCVYLPIWALLAIGLTVLAIWLDANSSANVGPPEIAFCRGCALWNCAAIRTPTWPTYGST
ncbi:hypothetical protein ACO0M4_13955 [Streptomyces sp. RGM 3693]|uniref:hypothetical protein n=1 Tax=Streptomyces sp. RGM 3693 TaxID=3413284 RepID=UPI003D2CE8D6